MTNRTALSTGLNWILALAAMATAAGAVITLLSGRRTQRRIAHTEHKADIKAWENEGGNLK